MNQHTINDRALALAGIFQAAGLVYQIAHQGTMETSPYSVSIASIFEINPASTTAVYGSVQGLHYGLQLIMEQLSGDSAKRNMEIVKYLVAMMHLERQLNRRPTVLEKVSAGIDKARSQSLHYSLSHDNVIASLANCYTETISNLTPRIIVSGEHGYLTNPNVANKVRALLLAGIRSAVLWRQIGGNRLQLLFGRRGLLEAAHQLLGTR
jgi:high frequency lysogenization protein